MVIRDSLGTEPSRLATGRAAARMLLIWGMALAVLVVVSVALTILSHLRVQAEARLTSSSQYLVRSIQQTLDGVMEAADVGLLGASLYISDQAARGPLDRAAITRYLECQAEPLLHLAYLRATDADGNVIFGPGLVHPPNNLADRDYFQKLKADPNAGMVTSGLIYGRQDQRPAWVFARRIHLSGNRFGGMVFARIDREAIRNLLAQIKLEPGTSVSVRDEKLDLIVRLRIEESGVPAATERSEKPMSKAMQKKLAENRDEGTYVTDAQATDGVARTHSYLRSERHGFTVNVGLPRQRVLDEWNNQLWIICGLVILTVLASMGFTSLIARAWAKQDQDLDHIRASRELLHEAQQIANLGHYTYDLVRNRWDSSDILDRILGIDASHDRTVSGWLELVAPDMRQDMADYLAGIVERAEPFDREYRILRPRDGQERWVHGLGTFRRGADGCPILLVGTIQDISERKQAQEIIRNLAFHDQLTGLPNRTLLQDRLRQAMVQGERSGNYGAVLFIDLDNFKQLNDTHGHAVGDILLRRVADRLVECVRAEDTVARLGGDEFVVVLVGLRPDHRAAHAKAKKVGLKILEALNQPYDLEGIAHASSPSIGVALFQGQGLGLDEVLKQADIAMYQSKSRGRNALSFYDGPMSLN